MTTYPRNSKQGVGNVFFHILNYFFPLDYVDFPVRPRPSISTTMIGAAGGDCTLAFTPQRQIVCALSPGHQIVGVWPFGCLRKYWGGKDHFGFISGRRSPRGEGEFVFSTNRGEEIYRILERTIQLASSVLKDEVRPPASLPPDTTTSGEKTPPVSSSESDDDGGGRYVPPPVPNKPPDLLKRLSTVGSMSPPLIPDQEDRLSPLGIASADVSDVSETAPAYMLNRTVSLASSRPPPHVPITEHARATSMRAPPKSTRALPVPNMDEDDTYSHATHTLPKQYNRNPSLKIIEGGKVYNGLVHSGSSISRNQPPTQNPSRTRPKPEADTQLYDLAYLPSSDCPKDLTQVGEGDYGSVGDPNQPKRKIIQTNGEMLSRDTQSFGAKLRGRTDSAAKIESSLQRQTSDGLTSNPAYGSQEDILNFIQLDGNSLNTDEHRGNAGEGYCHEGVVDSGNPLGLGMDDSMVMNPVYGEHKQPAFDDGFSGGDATSMLLPVINPLEDSLTTNPIYGGHRKPGMGLQNNRAKSKDGPLNSNGSKGGQLDSTVSKGKSEGPFDSTASNNSEGSRNSTVSKWLKETANSLDDTLVHTDEEKIFEDINCQDEEDGGCSDEKESRGREDGMHISGDGSNLDSNNKRNSEVEIVTEDTDIHISGGDAKTVGDGKAENNDEDGSPVIRRDTKGYSKVNKKKTNEEELINSGDFSPPPPLPDRMYSNGSST